ncbi:hypothetical protein L1887_24195 [Cichorium endivia]|nr:hypothetical protein L1887_24195 [Cichorium endivia]
MHQLPHGLHSLTAKGNDPPVPSPFLPVITASYLFQTVAAPAACLKAYSTVGTPNNIGPEVLLNKDCRSHLKFPPEAQLSFEAKDLINKLLCNVNRKRGLKRADEIKSEHQIKSHQDLDRGEG